ncbi:LON peptidase substrate-binding domain-containing protein [Neiella marina]|uniref:LON peptidase substrate-binding domain-containing protein n=1 Tax=Neiella holothuriorum TaxID=2870530 RepID=A0ABS7ECV2_9GAMM|nr:LON peptidase substrate-binding domain-containing protein [Neiella holothuriorum]MBW8190049.1 LON peptidase substrate-binding domain-containing protein [Neiella holothuriorum]
MSQQQEFALFPLTAHVLPGGKLPLRIFEPKYIRMVRDAAAGGRQLCMCMLDTHAKPDTLMNMYPLITEVAIVDFDQLADGMLGITVQGLQKRRLQRVWVEHDGLKIGATETIADWPQQALSPEQCKIVERLQQLYHDNDSLQQLRLEFHNDDASWLCQRWLELLPMDPNDKQLLIEQPDCNAALAFLQQAIRTL